MSRNSSLAARGLLAAALLLASAPSVRAVTLRWLDPAGGNAANAGKWSPAQVPGAADEARFDTTGAYTVTWNATTDSTGSMRFRRGDVTLVFTSLHDIATQLAVGQSTGDKATVIVDDGTLRAGWSLLVGTGSGSDATLVVDGATADVLQNTGPGTPLMSVGGTGGQGLVRLAQGGRLALADRLHIGIGAGGQATMRVRGEGAGAGARRSQLLAEGPTPDVRIGADDSHGVLEVLDGGLARLGRTVFAGEEPGDSAEVIVGGRGTNDSSRVQVLGDLLLAANRRSVGGGGWSRVTLDSLGVIEVTDSTEIGDPDGSDARLTLAPGSRFVTRHLALRQPTVQALDLEGGLLQIRGGTLSSLSGRLVVPGAAGDPTIELLDGAFADLVGSAGSPPLELAVGADATLRLTGGAVMTLSGGTPTLSATSGAASELRVSGGAAFSSAMRLVAGAAGPATVNVVDQGQLLAAGIDVGVGNAATSLFSVSHSGQVTSSGSFNVGGTSSAGGGRAQVTVGEGGLLSLSHPTAAGTLWPVNLLRVMDEGRLELASAFQVRGELHVAGGSVSGGAVALRDQGVLHGTGSVTSPIAAGIDTTVAIVAEGPLTLGHSASPSGFLMRGRLEVGGAAVTLLDADSAIVGNVQLSGGTLQLPARGGVVEAGKRVLGHGVVRGDLTPRGIVCGSGGELQFAGKLLGTGEGVSADSMRFLAGSAFAGAGVLDGRVRCDSGSVIRATGALTLGRVVPNPLPSALVLRGRIETGPHAVTLANSHNPTVTGAVVLGGGSLGTTNTTLITATFGSRIEGRGRVLQALSGNTVFSPGPVAGRLRFESTLGIGFQSRFEVDLGDLAAGEHDTLSVAGALSIGASTVLDVRRLPSFAALPGDSFRVIEHGSRTGTFATATLDGAPAAGLLDVRYHADGVWVVLLPGILSAGDGPGPANDAPALRFSAIGSPGHALAVDLALPAATHARIEVFDVHGRRVAALHDGPLAAGRHRLALPADDAGAGVRFARATLGEGAEHTTRTVRLVRLR